LLLALTLSGARAAAYGALYPVSVSAGETSKASATCYLQVWYPDQCCARARDSNPPVPFDEQRLVLLEWINRQI
jgi:hypothetical protein